MKNHGCNIDNNCHAVKRIVTRLLSTVPCHVVDYLVGTAEPHAHGFDILEPGQSRHQAVT